MGVAAANDAEVRELLEGLGEDSASVAEALREAGVTGLPNRADCCPIAMWLEAKTGADAVVVDKQNVELRFARADVTGDPADDEYPPYLNAEPPAAVARFITDFDAGEYPDLEADPEDD